MKACNDVHLKDFIEWSKDGESYYYLVRTKPTQRDIITLTLIYLQSLLFSLYTDNVLLVSYLQLVLCPTGIILSCIIIYINIQCSKGLT